MDIRKQKRPDGTTVYHVRLRHKRVYYGAKSFYTKARAQKYWLDSMQAIESGTFRSSKQCKVESRKLSVIIRWFRRTYLSGSLR